MRRDRVLLAAIAALALFAAADTLPGRAGSATEHDAVTVMYQPVANAQALDLDHPQQVLLSPRSVQRYLRQVDNGEKIREQRVVETAAVTSQQRAGLAPAPAPAATVPLPAPVATTPLSTLEQAKREAAAAAAGQWQPWMGGNPGDTSALAAAGIGGIAPSPGGYVVPAIGQFTSGFGARWGTFHAGIDIANAIGTPIYAVAAGTVIDAGPASGFGLWVRIRHDDGTITVYGHMYDFFVTVGERVPAGMQIARIGNRGDSTGPHLHFEVIINGQHVDPQKWLALHGIQVG